MSSSLMNVIPQLPQIPLLPDFPKNLLSMGPLLPPIIPLLPQLAQFSLPGQSAPTTTTKKPKQPAKKRVRKCAEVYPITEPVRLMPLGSPDLVIYEGPMNKRPAHNMQFQMREIKAEPVDTYETTTPAPTIQQPPGFPMSITGGIPQMGPPLLQAPFFPNPFFVQNMMMQRTMGLQSPNERVYSLLQEDYARWKREFFKTSIMTAQTNSALKRHMCFLTNKETLPTEMLIIESKFEHIRMKIVERLNYDQKVVLYKELIQNLVGLESLVGDKREELEPFELFNWLDGQLIPLEQKQYFHIVLPSYKDMMDLISDTFIRLNLKGIDFSQRQIFISALRHDWSDPKTYIARIEALSPVVRMAPLRILDILERTRTELRNAIREKGYYWSIDTILPVFD